ncbi:MAG: Holliday junction branch migration protein RuvA [Chlamydiia bacterium]
MLAFLRGTVVEASPESCILDVAGVGYLVAIPEGTYRALPAQKEQVVSLHIHWVWREQSGPALYGFATQSEKELFSLLLDLNGVGPKTALAIVGHLPVERLIEAVRTQNPLPLCKVPGIGKKTAERLVTELQSRIGEISCPASSSHPELPLVGDAIRALMHLGYSQMAAERAVRAAATPDAHDLGQLITSALQRV